MKYLSLSIVCISTLLLFACEAGSDQSLSASASSESLGGDGQGGSLARFTITGNHLYTVTSSNLTAYDISNPIDPQKKSDIEIGAAIETIFPYENMLFIGSQTGMLIYDNTNPESPRFVSRYDHIMSCDPVVVQGDYAYVTLRDGTDCRFGSNLLDVIDISNPANPVLLNSYFMLNPHGLGVDGDNLFVCEGTHGIKVFDLNDPTDPQESRFIEDFHTFDVIPNNGVLIITGEDGIFQYRYDQNQNLNLLSQLQ